MPACDVLACLACQGGPAPGRQLLPHSSGAWAGVHAVPAPLQASWDSRFPSVRDNADSRTLWVPVSPHSLPSASRFSSQLPALPTSWTWGSPQARAAAARHCLISVINPFFQITHSAAASPVSPQTYHQSSLSLFLLGAVAPIN